MKGEVVSATRFTLRELPHPHEASRTPLRSS